MKLAMHKRTNTIWFDLYEVPRIVKFTETESRMGVCRGRGREENGKLLFTGCRVSVWEVEKVLEMDSGDSCITVWMYLMPLICTLKNG